MMTNETGAQPIANFNGWSNEETWSTHLQITNEPERLKHWHSKARSYLREDAQGAEVRLADELETYYLDQGEKAVERLKQPVICTLISNALGKVHFQEIAKQFIEDVTN